ncbi:MAG: PIN domain-containing protein [Hyphomonadaceae bacterium]
MRAADTNLLVRLIAKDDADQERLAREAASPGAWISTVALVEAIWVLKSYYGLDRQRIASTVATFLNHQNFVVQDADTVTAALAVFQRNKKVEFSDCLIVEMARKAGHLPLVTFDRDLAKLDGAERIDAL